MNLLVFFSSTSFLSFTFYTLDRGLCDASDGLHRDGKLKYAHFKDYLFHILDVPKVEEAIVPTRNHCLQRCVKNPQCFSANIAAFYRRDGNVSCDLLPTDKFSVPEKFQANHSFHHYSILVSCCEFKFLSNLGYYLLTNSTGFWQNAQRNHIISNFFSLVYSLFVLLTSN